jgi:hypothetical protein
MKHAHEHNHTASIAGSKRIKKTDKHLVSGALSVLTGVNPNRCAQQHSSTHAHTHAHMHVLLYLWRGHAVDVVTHNVFDGLACSALDAAGGHLKSDNHVHILSIRLGCSSSSSSSRRSSTSVRNVQQRQAVVGGGASELVISSKLPARLDVSTVL